MEIETGGREWPSREWLEIESEIRVRRDEIKFWALLTRAKSKNFGFSRFRSSVANQSEFSHYFLK